MIKVESSTTTRQTISSSIIRALSLLEMSNSELEKVLEKESLQNPFFIYDRGDMGSQFNSDQDFLENIATQNTLLEDFKQQIAEEAFEDGSYYIFILDNLDSDGFIDHKDFSGIDNVLFEKYRIKVRDYFKNGIASNNSFEAIETQLTGMGSSQKCIDFFKKIAASNSIVLKNNSFKNEDMAEYLKEIRKTSPYPGRGISNSYNEGLLIPDIYLKTTNKKLSISIDMCGECSYSKEIKKTSDPEIKNFLSQAENLNILLSYRKETLKKVMLTIIDFQKEYFNGGELIPLTMKQVSEKLGVNESSISRAVNNKTIDFNGTVITMRSLFSGFILTKNNIKVSSACIKRRIKNIIKNEDKDCSMSDNNIARRLMFEGYIITRRTVSKYRDSMGIKSFKDRNRK